MPNQKIDLRLSVIIGLIFLAAMSRLLPHPPNFSPIGGIALFGATYFSRKWLAFLLPATAIWISSLILDNVVYASLYPGFQWFSHPWVYVSFGLIACFGLIGLKKITVPRLIGCGLGASVIFFLVSNLGPWLANPLYSKDFSGLVACYIAAIPFFWNTLAGDLFYIAVLFGVFEWMQRTVPQTKPNPISNT